MPNECAAPTAAQAAPKAGHNNPPVSGLFGFGAPWLRFATELELGRLATLHVRIRRKKQAMADLAAERRAIMMRCIRRMRRAKGKN